MSLLVYFLVSFVLLFQGGQCELTWYKMLSARLDDIVFDMKSKDNSITTQVQELKTMVTATNQQLASFEKRLSAVAECNAKLVAVEERFANIDNRLKEVAAAEVGRRTHLLRRGLEQEKAATMTRFDSLQKNQEKILLRMDDIERFQVGVDGQWGTWNSWSLCTHHCNQTRTRACNNPAPMLFGSDCPGLTTQTQECNTYPCGGKDCTELLRRGAPKISGVYNITTPLSHTKIKVVCDMQTDGGGWTVFQKRFNGSEDFYRNFSDYEKGFGNVYAEHWLGLKYIYEITTRGSYQLRVDIVRSNGSKGYDVYGGFSLSPGTNYTLNVGSRVRSDGLLNTYHSFSDGDSAGIPVGNAFSTYDHDVDRSSINCAAECKGGWWYSSRCYDYINLNSLYRPKLNSWIAMIYDSPYGLAASSMMFKSVS